MQDYATHRRFHPLYHFVALPLASVAAIWALWRFAAGPTSDTALLALLALGLVTGVLGARVQALRVQDRVIRLEMAIRFARVLPPDLAARAHELKLRQIIALRFAGDAELPELTRKTLAGEFATSRAIKQAIHDWQADYLRA